MCTHACVQAQPIVTPASTAVYIYQCAYVTVEPSFSGPWMHRPHTYASRGLVHRHVSMCLYFTLLLIFRALARLPFAPWLEGWEVTAVGPDSPIHPTLHSTSSLRLSEAVLAHCPHLLFICPAPTPLPSVRPLHWMGSGYEETPAIGYQRPPAESVTRTICGNLAWPGLAWPCPA